MWIDGVPDERDLLMIYAASGCLCGFLLIFVVQQAEHDKAINTADSTVIRWIRRGLRFVVAGIAFWSVMYFSRHPETLSMPSVVTILGACAILIGDAVALHVRRRTKNKHSGRRLPILRWPAR